MENNKSVENENVIVSMENSNTIIHARDAEEGKVYLSAVMKYKIKIIKKCFVNSSREDLTCTRVQVESETYPGILIDIAGGTELLPYVEEEHVTRIDSVKEIKKVVSSTESKSSKTNKTSQIINGSQINKYKGEVTNMEPKVKNPRSKVIDQLLLTASATPDANYWESVADEVIKAGCDTEDKRKSIISQAKARHNWYFVKGIVNPLSKPVAEATTVTEQVVEEPAEESVEEAK